MSEKLLNRVIILNLLFQSKAKQTYKPVLRSCKLKAEQTIKEWRSKMVDSEMDALQQEVQLMQKGVRQLNEAIISVDKQLENICSGTSILESLSI